ncbi:MAG TPA: glycosyltransferase [Acidobacteriaceae bacterium]|jgi:ceramide glucosyltransferase|nr:glycosyltransferase [Acidobacteriaceae bacterium]
MSLLLRIMLYGALAGTVTSAIYCAMVLVGALRFARRKRREERQPAEYLPPVSVLKPLHGTEPDLEENLRRFFDLDYPEYELLFCARHADDTGLQMAQRIAAEHPEVRARFLTCGEPKFPNAKMWSMAMLAQAAEYEALVTSDADARVSRDYLRRSVQELADPKRELASCLYVGRTTGGLAAQLDAVGKSVEMSGGILVADLIEGGTRFALGVSMVLRRGAFTKAGGYEELGQFYAEDFVLGQRLAEAGYGVRMANYVVRLMVLPQGLRASFVDQLRWMKSTRRSRPAGHLGTGLTYALPFGLLGLVWGIAAGHPALGALWLLATCVNRWVMAAVVLWAIEDEQAAWPSLIYPLRDLLGFAVWVASYMGSTMRYHGGAYSLGVGGRFEPVDKK